MRKVLVGVSSLLLSVIFIMSGFTVMASGAWSVPPLEGSEEENDRETEVLYVSTQEETGSVVGVSVEKQEYEGVCLVAAYCGCDACCGGERSKLTYAGTQPKAGRTVAADLTRFSLGEELILDGQTYIVEDKTSSEGNAVLLVYFDSHEEAVQFGRKEMEVYHVKKPASPHNGKFLGTFTVTGYCACGECCGETGKEPLTATEVKPQAGHTIAADWDILPVGTEIEIDGLVYVVEDTGSNIKGNRLDIYFDTHEEAVIYGRKTKEVYAAKQ